MNKTAALAVILAGSSVPHCAFAQPDINALVTMQPDKLRTAILQTQPEQWAKISRPDLWRLLNNLEADKPKEGRHSFAFYAIQRELEQRGQAEDLTKLLTLYNANKHDVFFQSRLTKSLFAIWVRLQMQQAAWPHQPLVFPASTNPLPPELSGAKPELQSAWRYYDAVSQPYRTAFPDARRNGKYIPVQENYPAYFKQVGLTFQGVKGSPEILKQYEWAGGCGTGADVFTEPQQYAIFAGLWQEGRWVEAAGAAMKVAQLDFNYYRGLNPGNAWSKEFLTRCGVDWEKLAVGSMLHNSYNWGSGALAAHGSDAAVKYVVSMSALSPVAARHDFLKLVASYIEPVPVDGVITGGRPTGRRVDPEIQTRLLAHLHAVAQSTDPEANHDVALDEICSLRRPESIPTFRALLSAPRNEVRRKAYDVLLLMKQEVTAPEELKPVRLRVRANGAPLVNSSIRWATMSEGSQRTSSSATTDEGGILSLPRDYFVDNRVVLDGIELSSSPDGSVSFNQIVPLPANLDNVAEVNIPVTEVRLLVSGGEGFKPPVEGLPVANITILREVKRYGAIYFDSYSTGQKAVLGQEKRMVISNGRYQFQIDVGGAQRWDSGPVEITGGKFALNPQVLPGADLKFTVIAPGGEARDKNVLYEIRRDGKKLDLWQQWDYNARTYRNLPLGEYKIRILPSAESAAQRNRQEIVTHPAYQGRELTVVLDGTKPLVDLGEIQLEPAIGG